LFTFAECKQTGKPRIHIRQLSNYNIRQMSNAVKLFEICQRSNVNSNFVTSLKIIHSSIQQF